jgi:hypothetical protein
LEKKIDLIIKVKENIIAAQKLEEEVSAGLRKKHNLKKLSYDQKNGVLTIATFSLTEGVHDYVNSLWEQQKNPCSGDAINAYNDGPIDGKQMGKFYELESSSPAAALAPGATIKHVHRTIHLKGTAEALDFMTKKLIGEKLEDIVLQ